MSKSADFDLIDINREGGRSIGEGSLQAGVLI
jgi:hypothetical protein